MTQQNNIVLTFEPVDSYAGGGSATYVAFTRTGAFVRAVEWIDDTSSGVSVVFVPGMRREDFFQRGEEVG
jgi:hypothetical protein